MESNATRFPPSLFPPIHAYEQQKEASFKPTHDPPLLHIPLRFKSTSTSASNSSPSTTAWSTIDLDLHAMTRYFALFSQGAGTQRESESGPALPTPSPIPQAPAPARPIPKDAFACVTFVKVYANCRLRRIWFSESKHSSSSGVATHTPWEFQLYAADADSD